MSDEKIKIKCRECNKIFNFNKTVLTKLLKEKGYTCDSCEKETLKKYEVKECE